MTLTSDPWSVASMSAGLFARRISDRASVTATLINDSAAGEVAWCMPATGAITLNAAKLDALDEQGAVRAVIFTRPVERYRNPVISGALVHEAAHAAHTLWTLDVPAEVMASAAYKWALKVEEIRIERLAVLERPADQPLLRASASHVLGWLVGDRGQSALVTALVLMLPRADIGVLTDADVDASRTAVQQRFGESLCRAVAAVIAQSSRVGDRDAARMLRLGARLGELVAPLLADDDQPESGCGGASHSDDAGRDAQGPGTADHAASEPTGNEPSPGREATSRDDDARAIVLADLNHAEQDARDQSTARARALATHETRLRDGDQHSRAASIAATDVFVHGTGNTRRAAGTPIHWKITQRPAEPRDTRLREQAFRAFKAASHRDVTRTRIPAQSPGGRLRSNELMKMQAQIARGVPVTAQPWHTLRTTVDKEPPLYCGIVTDVSGSMQQWQQPLMSTAWAMTHAVARLKGQVAACAFSDRVRPVITAGTVPTTVPQVEGSGGSSGCSAAIRAVAGNLRLAHRSGARVLIVLTDGELPRDDDLDPVTAWLAGRGIALVWALTTTADAHARRPVVIPRGVEAVFGLTPDDVVPTVIGACSRALTRAR